MPNELPNISPASASLDSLYRRYVVMVRNRALRLLGDTDAAQDIAQEVFVKFLENDRSEEQMQNVAGFLYRMATNASLDRLRVKYRHTSYTPDMGEPTQTPGLEDQLALKKVLAMCKDEDARIAVYYYIDGMDQEEISELTQVPRRTVSHHLDRFRTRARRLLGQQVGEDKENAHVG